MILFAAAGLVASQIWGWPSGMLVGLLIGVVIARFVPAKPRGATPSGPLSTSADDVDPPSA